jgi:serine protease Do
LADYLKIKDTTGVIVSEVEPQSPAAKAGIAEGDVILAIDDMKISNISAYRSKIKAISANQTIRIDTHRDGKKTSRNLKTAIFPLDRALDLANQRLGITVSDINQQIRTRYGLQSRSGVMIVRLRRQSHLAGIGVKPGDIIRQIDEARVDNLVDFKAAIVKHRNKPSVVLVIQRDGHLYHINVPMKDDAG